jgi:hypothetical protein
LTPRGRLVLEPSLEYLHSSATRISLEGFTILPALLIGLIDIAEADRNTEIVTLAARYGITNGLEVELTVPYVFRNDSQRQRRILTGTPRDSIVNQRAMDLGDMGLGLRYQIPRPSPAWPFMVANLQIKSDSGTDPYKLATEAEISGKKQDFPKIPTGTGFWSVSPSLTFIYPSDPVVFFGNVGYLYNFAADKTIRPDLPNVNFGEVSPGNAIRLNFGMGIGLNDRSSLSLSYSLDLYERTRIANEKPPDVVGSDATVGRFIIGYSLKTPGGTPLNLSVAIGTTKDAPDSDLTFRVPFNFDLFR